METAAAATNGASRLRLSVLDLIPVRAGQTTAQALSASVQLVRAADRLGFRRYWVAEHHNMAAVASTSPPVLLARFGAETQRIRIGSGGVMLLNHQSLVVAEQFVLLSQMYPGRVDLGVGRAPGTDPVTSYVLRAGRDQRQQIADYPEQISELADMIHDEYSFELADGRSYRVHPSPNAREDVPDLWLLGSSMYSARLAAQLGTHYVFASHFAGADAGTGRALDAYRSEFAGSGEPRTFITANVVVAETAAEAAELALPQLLAMAKLQTTGETAPVLTVEQAHAAERTPQQGELMARMREHWIIGTPAVAAAKLHELADRFGVDEVMIQPLAGARDGDPVDRVPARERMLELLAAAI